MEEEDDDFYDPADLEESPNAPSGQVKDEELEEGEEEDEADEESDDDINFITDAKSEPKPEPPQVKRQVSTSAAAAISPATDLRGKTSTPQVNIKQEALGERTASAYERPGTDYPGRHTSTLDPNANPIHPATGKPILSTDFDTDFGSESTKSWRKPGSDITDYFNYGFDEFTWASYCLKQQQMSKEITGIKNEAEQMKAFVEGIGSGGLPGMPGMPGLPAAPAAPVGNPGMPPMPGMPTPEEMQQMQQMMNMNPDFMQMMNAGGGAGFGAQDGGFGVQVGNQQQQQQQQHGGYGGGGGFDHRGGGGYRGRGRGRW